MGLRDRLLVTGKERFKEEIDYDAVHNNIKSEKEKSIKFLQKQLKKVIGE